MMRQLELSALAEHHERLLRASRARLAADLRTGARLASARRRHLAQLRLVRASRTMIGSR